MSLFVDLSGFARDVEQRVPPVQQARKSDAIKLYRAETRATAPGKECAVEEVERKART
jgi:hypothetical protein